MNRLEVFLIVLLASLLTYLQGDEKPYEGFKNLDKVFGWRDNKIAKSNGYWEGQDFEVPYGNDGFD
ncbi:MAG: hypothetical protein ACXU9U_01990, partial [Parachlamydiaceae bacterium]